MNDIVVSCVAATICMADLEICARIHVIADLNSPGSRTADP